MLMGFDLGCRTGWASYGKTGYDCGFWRLAKRKADDGVYLRLRTCLRMVFEKSAIEQVAVERPQFFRSSKAAERQFGFLAIFRELCYEFAVPVEEYTPTHLKKFATDNGRATKDDMQAKALATWPELAPETHDACDALWVLERLLWEQERGKTAEEKP